jgi:hypothetical protein
MTMTDFELFQKECKKWIEFFGLTDYKIYFSHKPLEDCYADVVWEHPARAATFRLNSKMSEEDETDKDIKQTAFHEVTHLLMAKLTYLARLRYTTPEEIQDESERIGRILTNTVYPNIKLG